MNVVEREGRRFKIMEILRDECAFYRPLVKTDLMVGVIVVDK